MATNGTVATSSWYSNYGYSRYVQLVWNKKSIDVEKQTTTISWVLSGAGGYTGYVTSGPFYVYIDNKEVFNSETRIKLYPGDVIASGETTLQHNADGTKAFTIQLGAAIYTSSIKYTGSASFSLDVVGKVTITSAPNFNDEQNPTIYYSNPVGDKIESLWAAISFTGAEVDIAYRSIPVNGTSYTFTLSDAERKILRAGTQGSTSRKLRFYLRSYVNGNPYFHWKEVTYTVINAIPTLTASVVDINETTKALTGDASTLIRYHSTALATMEATAYKEATIAYNYIEHENNTTANRAITGTYPNVSGNVFAFTAIDSRGAAATKTIVAPMIDYIRPTANIDETELMTPDGIFKLKVNGNYYNDTFGYTDAAQANTLKVEYRYKVHGEEWENNWYTEDTVAIENNTYTLESVFGLDYRTTYVFQVRVTDKLNTVLSAETVIRSLPIFHWGENDFTFEVPVNFNAGATGINGGGDCAIVDGVYEGDLNITGNLRLKGSGNYGNKINFGDSEYTYIEEATDDNLTIKATTINFDGLLKYKDNSIEYGAWLPELNVADAVASYTMQWGWYLKLGITIVIGFNLKAEINAGYSSNSVSVSGCPFTPVFSAFGGGIAHNIAFSAGHCFEGWAIGTDGLITPRGQPCNNTTLTNLNITSTAYYPTGNNTTTMTLGGIISFMGR